MKLDALAKLAEWSCDVAFLSLSFIGLHDFCRSGSLPDPGPRHRPGAFHRVVQHLQAFPAPAPACLACLACLAGAQGGDRQQRVHAADLGERAAHRAEPAASFTASPFFPPFLGSKSIFLSFFCSVFLFLSFDSFEGRRAGAAIVRAGMDWEDSEALERLGFSKDSPSGKLSGKVSGQLNTPF